jgi:hypothetical protein
VTIQNILNGGIFVESLNKIMLNGVKPYGMMMGNLLAT